MFGCKNTHENIIFTRVHSGLSASKYLPKPSLHFFQLLWWSCWELIFIGKNWIIAFPGYIRNAPMKLICTPDLELAQITQVILTPKTRQKRTRRLQQRMQPDLSPKTGVSSTHPESMANGNTQVFPIQWTPSCLKLTSPKEWSQKNFLSDKITNETKPFSVC